MSLVLALVSSGVPSQGERRGLVVVLLDRRCSREWIPSRRVVAQPLAGISGVAGTMDQGH